MYEYKIRNQTRFQFNFYHPCLGMFEIIIILLHDENTSWWIVVSRTKGITGPLGRLLRNFVESMMAREINPLPHPPFFDSFLVVTLSSAVSRYIRASACLLTENI